MFGRSAQKTENRLTVTVVTADAAIQQRVRHALEGGFVVTARQKSIVQAAADLLRKPPTGPLVVEIDHRSEAELAALQKLLTLWQPAPPVIVLTDGVSEAAARRFLKLQISDWLARDSSANDIAQAVEHAVRPTKLAGAGKPARCTAFMSAVGGAGSTTLCIAALPVLIKTARGSPSSACIVDLDFQTGTICDYLDLTPNLQIQEIRLAPERLDGQLLDVMLTRHPSGFSVLAAPPSLTGAGTINADLVGRLLDLVSTKFEHVLIDMPRIWMPWSESVARGLDDLFITTELTVAGLRHARQLADALADACKIDPAGTVIVNKCRWLTNSGLKKGVAGDVLGERLAGFVGDCEQVIRDAQNKGMLLSDVKRSNRIETDLSLIFRNRITNRSKVGVTATVPALV